MQKPTRIEVRYAETDKMGVVYHANYLIWLEVARTEFLKSLGFSYAAMEEKGFQAPVISLTVDYGRPLKYGDVALVFIEVTKLTPARVEYSYEIYAETDDLTSKPRLKASTTHCIINAQTFKPVNQRKVMPEIYEAYKKTMVPTQG